METGPWPGTVAGRSIPMKETDRFQSGAMISVEVRQDDIPHLQWIDFDTTSLGGFTPGPQHRPGAVDGHPALRRSNQSTGTVRQAGKGIADTRNEDIHGHIMPPFAPDRQPGHTDGPRSMAGKSPCGR